MDETTREAKIQAYIKATVSPSCRTERTLRLARIEAERYLDRATGYGEYDVIKGEFK